jgi:hypothetical protein
MYENTIDESELITSYQSVDWINLDVDSVYAPTLSQLEEIVLDEEIGIGITPDILNDSVDTMYDLIDLIERNDDDDDDSMMLPYISCEKGITYPGIHQELSSINLDEFFKEDDNIIDKLNSTQEILEYLFNLED